ncbi:MAG: PAS domain S-box protein [Spirochaetales bacterium]|nr:PAS domain S-box protein [Spirochaetales bacterium]
MNIMFKRDLIPELLEEIHTLRSVIEGLEEKGEQLEEAREKLADSDERFRLIIGHTTDAVFCYEQRPPIPLDIAPEEQLEKMCDGILIECNEVFAGLCGEGKRREDVVGKTLRELVGPIPLIIRDFLLDFIGHGYHLVEREVVCTFPDGEKRSILNNCHGVIEHGRIVRVWGSFKDITEKRQMMTALEKSEKKYRDLFEEAPISLWEADLSGVKEYIGDMIRRGVEDPIGYIQNHPDSIKNFIGKIRIVSVNKETLRLCEAESKEDLQANLISIYTEKTLETIREQLADILSGKFSSQLECQFRTLKGREINVAVQWILPDEYRETWSKTLFSVVDITEKKQAEILLRLQHDIASSFNTSGSIKDVCTKFLYDLVGIDGIDSGGIYLRNPETGGINLISHIGLSDDFIKAVSRFDAYSRQSTILLNKKPFYTEYSKAGIPMDQPQKAERLKALFVLPILYGDTVIGSLNVASHVSDEIPLYSRTIIEAVGGMIGSYLARLDAEAALRESEERYSMLVQNIPYVTWISDSDGISVFVSDNVIRYYGFTPEEICGFGSRYWFDRIHPDDSEDVTKAWRELFENGRAYDMEYRIKHKDGRWIWILDRAVNTFEKDGRQYAYGIFTDITRKKQTEEYLRQSEKLQAIGQLAGGIAHDFNNQLAAMLIYAELLQSAVTGNPKLEGHVTNMLSCINHSSSLVSKLLAFSRKGKLDSVDLDVHAIIMEVINILSHSVNKKIRILYDFKAAMHYVSGDPSQLQNALLNIAINSRDAIQGSGWISFETENVELDLKNIDNIPLCLSPGTYIIITVRDNGTGMDTDVLHRIFEPFFTTKDKGKGTGLGMAAVYGTVKKHKGGIRVSSELGAGSAVEIYLPVITPLEKNRTETRRRFVQRKRPLHILFVDDEKVICSSIRTMLSQSGYRVSTRNNGMEAVEFYAAAHEDVDLVILDMIMPEMNGLEVFLKMKEIHHGIKALIVSGYSVGDDIGKAREAGVAGFLQKPFGLSDITEKISSILKEDT